MEAHVKQLTGIQIDESGKDISRLCFMSFDPELYVNANADEIVAVAGAGETESRAASRSVLSAIASRPQRRRSVKCSR